MNRDLSCVKWLLNEIVLRTNRNNLVKQKADGSSGVNLRKCEIILVHNVLKERMIEGKKKAGR